MPKTIHTESGKLFQKLRENRNITQMELAKFLGYRSAQFISNWERGLSIPPAKTIKKIFKYYENHGDEWADVALRKYVRALVFELVTEFNDQMRDLKKDAGL